jgi:hypothetical protein
MGTIPIAVLDHGKRGNVSGLLTGHSPQSGAYTLCYIIGLDNEWNSLHFMGAQAGVCRRDVMNSTLMKQLGCAVLILLIAAAFTTLPLVWLFSSSPVTHIPSPVVPGSEIWVVAWGYQDRTSVFFAKNSQKEPEELFECSEDYANQVYLQWTKDGQAVVLTLEGNDGGNPPNPITYGEGAYDFLTGKAILKPDKNGDIEATKKSVAEMVTAHGGLDGQRSLLTEEFSRTGKHLPFWQVPSVNPKEIPPLFPGYSGFSP